MVSWFLGPAEPNQDQRIFSRNQWGTIGSLVPEICVENHGNFYANFYVAPPKIFLEQIGAENCTIGGALEHQDVQNHQKLAYDKWQKKFKWTKMESAPYR